MKRIFGWLTLCAPRRRETAAYPRHCAERKRRSNPRFAEKPGLLRWSSPSGRPLRAGPVRLAMTQDSAGAATPCENLGSHAGKFAVLCIANKGREDSVTKALEKTYDGIIIGAGHHGLILGSYLAKAGLSVLTGRPAAAIRRRPDHQGSDRAGLLSQPAFHQSFPYFRDAVVQGSRPRRPGHLHHAALRIRPGAQRRHGAGLRARPRRDHRQRRALLQEGRRDLPRMESPRRGDHRARS